jgi:hypothetical protein
MITSLFAKITAKFLRHFHSNSTVLRASSGNWYVFSKSIAAQWLSNQDRREISWRNGMRVARQKISRRHRSVSGAGGGLDGGSETGPGVVLADFAGGIG